MADPASGFEELERYFETASLAIGRGDRAAAIEALRAIIRDAELRDDAIEPLTIALARLGDLELEEGRDADAEGHFQRALALGEQRLGPEHPDLVVLLNALSRLYLRRGAHELAEPLLQRLYAIKRTKGEDHPEVATVLASLANVRQALGRHDAAELLWRRVLEIRERTLAPNHVATASALERLAETCAARAKPVEAVQLMQRALSMRELTLGASHPTVRALRERIADLQLQASDEDTGGDSGFMPLTPSSSHSAIPSMPAWRSSAPASTLPPLPAMPTMPAAPVPPPPGAPFAPQVPHASPASHASQASTRSTSESAVAFAAAPTRPLTMEYAPPARTSAALVPVTDEHPAEAPAKSSVTFVMPGAADGGMALQQLLAEIDAEADAAANRPGVATRALSLLSDHRRPAIIAGVLVLLGAAFTVAIAGGTQDEVDPLGDMVRTSAPTASAVPGMGVTPAPYGPDGVVRTAATANTDGAAIVPVSNAAPAASDAATHRAEPDRVRDAGEPRPTGAAERATARPSVTPREQPKAASPATTTMSGPLTAMPSLRLDSITRAAAAATATATQDPLANRLTSMTAKSAIAESATPSSARGSSTQPARLIGSVPVARYPQSLRSSGVQGEVRVTFEVDTTGRPDMRSLVILKSDHDLFSSAVRNVVPEMRFVPAEVDGKKARWLVRMPFVFSVAK